MIEEYEQKAWDLLSEFNRITPHLLMRRFKVTMEFAQRICERIWLRQHKEARELALHLDLEWPAQMDKVKLKNLEKIKGKGKS